MKNVIVKARKINNIKSNIKYLHSIKEHPDICMTLATCPKSLWLEYQKVNQQEYKRSGQGGKCVEAHEMILVLPQEFYKLGTDERYIILQHVADSFKKNTGMEVYAAMHGSDKKEKNLHIHVMYMERSQTEEKEQVATRKTWIEEATGKKIRTKKEAYVDGELKPGIVEYQKGEVIKRISWTAKNRHLKSNNFTQETKEWWASTVNNAALYFNIEMEQRKAKERREKYHLKMQNLRTPKKYKDAEKMESSKRHCDNFNRPIITSNKFRKDYNDFIDSAIAKGILTNEEATERTKGVNEQIKELCLKGKKEKRKIKEVLENEVRALRILIAQNRQNELLKNDIGEALKEFEEVTNFGRKSVLERISEAKKISEEDKKKRDVKIKESDYERF
mgnify:FL=1